MARVLAFLAIDLVAFLLIGLGLLTQSVCAIREENTGDCISFAGFLTAVAVILTLALVVQALIIVGATGESDRPSRTALVLGAWALGAFLFWPALVALLALLLLP